jgi:hypothetical protein
MLIFALKIDHQKKRISIAKTHKTKPLQQQQADCLCLSFPREEKTLQIFNLTFS